MGGLRGIHLGEARTLGDGGRVVLGSNRPWANPPKVDYWLDYWLDYEPGLLVMLVILVILVRPLVRLLVILARLLVRLAIVARLLLALLPDFSDFLPSYLLSFQVCYSPVVFD